MFEVNKLIENFYPNLDEFIYDKNNAMHIFEKTDVT